MRNTRRRTALMELLKSSGRFQCACELHATLSRQGESLALSTVYRALQQFVESGDVDVFHPPDGAVDIWTTELSRDRGFKNIAHVTEIAGTCADCEAH
jgi:Fur family ferric uptake transcriptional regulator